MENVENFLPRKTYVSSKNVGKYGDSGQVIHNENVENVEKSVSCGKLPIVYTAQFAPLWIIVENHLVESYFNIFLPCFFDILIS